jgi:hypothetical protein
VLLNGTMGYDSSITDQLTYTIFWLMLSVLFVGFIIFTIASFHEIRRINGRHHRKR